MHIFHSTFNRRMAWIDEKNANWLSIYIGPSNRLGGMAQQRFMQACLRQLSATGNITNHKQLIFLVHILTVPFVICT